MSGAASWLAEAFESGDPLAPLPDGLAPRDTAEAEDIAFAVLDALGLVARGLRLWRRGDLVLVGPMLEERLLRSGSPIASRALRHATVSAAMIGVLATPLAAKGRAAPRFARIHPALDIAATRFTDTPAEAALLTADLAGLGLVVAGAGVAEQPGDVTVTLAGSAVTLDAAAAFAEAAAAARRLGGLPKGALLVVAGLTPPSPAAGQVQADFGALGVAEAQFTA